MFVWALALMAMACQHKTANTSCDGCAPHPASGAAQPDSVVALRHILTAPLSADSALAKLKAGNLRYVSNQVEAYKVLDEGRLATAQKQSPFAVVVSCSDSRVPAEQIFDLGVGEIFVVRSAGQVLDNASLGSIEYAAEHLGVKLVVVMGHERCGAVSAAVQGGEAAGHIAYLVEQIKPAVEAAKSKEGDLVTNAIHQNAAMIARQISSAKPVLHELVHKGELKVVSAYYDLDEGTVVFD